MTTIQNRELPNPINVRLPESLMTLIRRQAAESERTFSGQVRWLLSRAVKQMEKSPEPGADR